MSNQKNLIKYMVPLLLILILVVTMFAAYKQDSLGAQAKADPNVNVGIAFCGNTTAEAKLLIDRTKGYTNLFVLDSAGNPLSNNKTQVEEICDYAVSQGLKIMINPGTIYTGTWFWHNTFYNSTVIDGWKQRWGDKFLGIYYNDEPGGIQLDGNWTDWFRNYSSTLCTVDIPAINTLNIIYHKMLEAKASGTDPVNYDEEAYFFIQNILKEDPGLIRLQNASVPLFTADYCLYWFDYLGGYDTMFAELGWNSSVAQQIGLVKGAARLQDKDWGTIITWKYTQAPYLDSGIEIYNQMITSYEAGAKYIIIFNYPILSNYGAMTNEHFLALRKFWNTITTTDLPDLSKPGAVLVLPSNYGWGMRHSYDTIWGFWPPDSKSPVIADAANKLLAKYGASLDIVFDDSAYPVAKAGYETIYYWNQTI
jgi:hypothetical protein